ncbi:MULTISPECIES: hypothetical protein [Kribbella]|uniref:SAF domain-containing protein n=1 Tax=Kribbella karoonensis TaxID=324851 RepID=A0ABN2EA97_9ACTN
MSLSSSTRSTSQGSRAAGRPAGGGPNRLPSGRERRPALAALAVILILLGAAGSALIALNSGNRSDYVAISGTLPPGHKIEAKDFSRGDLAGATGGLVPWSQAGKYVGRYTTSWLYKDQFVTPDNFTKDGHQPIPQDGALVGVSLDAGHAPSDGLSVGDIVQVVRVPGGNDGGGNSTLLVGAATVTSSAGAITDSKTSANSSLNVTILVPQSKVNMVAAAAAAKTLSVAKLAPGTKTDVGSN